MEGTVEHHKRQGDALEHVHQRLSICENSITGLVESHEKISHTLADLAENVGRVAEVLEAFNNAKGFWMTIKFISGIAKAVLPILAFGAVLWAGFMLYVKGKS